MLKLLLRNSQCPGDVLMLTAAVRDLYRAHHSNFQLAVDTPYPELWENNPYIGPTEMMGEPDRIIDCEYPLVNRANHRPFHFIHGFIEDLERKLQLTIPVGNFCGDLHLSQQETSAPPPFGVGDGPYWIMVAGGKEDITTKWWNPQSFQAVVDHFRGKIRFVQCGAPGDVHFPLRNVLNLVGKTGLRDLIRLIYHANGVVCPVTFAMHVAAAVPIRPEHSSLKPCVVIAGGREPPHWEMYPGHQFLHTIGALNCCAVGGCWKSRCQPIGDGSVADNSLCLYPVRVRDDLQIARCMSMISPNKVIEAIELYEAQETSLVNGKSFIGSPHQTGSSNMATRIIERGVAVTIGVGRFEHLAHRAADEMHQMTGLPTVVLGQEHFEASKLEHPSFLKFRLFNLVDAENILWFDADMVPLAPWSPQGFFGGPAIIAVRDRMLGTVLDEANAWEVPPEEYFNAGMFIANAAAHKRWLQIAESLRFTKPTMLQDQSPLNAARVRLQIPLKLLDRRHNWLGFGSNSLSLDMPVYMAHKLAPDRLDLNEGYFEGRYELFAPQIQYDDLETKRLQGKTFTWNDCEGVKRITLREDGTLIPPSDAADEGYWFVHSFNSRPTLAFASETEFLEQFIETRGGDWISLSQTGSRLTIEDSYGTPRINKQNAKERADIFISTIPDYPDTRFKGRGIVICGGGEKYLPSAWVCIHILRELNCVLPIELWQLFQGEVQPEVQRALAQINVRCVDASTVRQQHPARFIGGWELKPYAILHSRFEEVLYLDADNMPVLEPTFLFDAPQFARYGAVFWPDYGRLAPDRSIWRICGVEYRDEPEFESGQILLNKRRCWKALQLALHLNEHSDFYYHHVHGDKELFHMAWRMLQQEFAMPAHPICSLPSTMCQHDFDGRRLFQHRNRDKWKLNGANLRISEFELEESCFKHLEQLERLCSSIPSSGQEAIAAK